jgi:hypothetical protein
MTDPAPPVRFSFRIRRRYYTRIVRGTKRREVRPDNRFWSTRVMNAVFAHGGTTGGFVAGRRRRRVLAFAFREGRAVATFVCGKDVHRRELVGIRGYQTPQAALGRKPSAQGSKDVGVGAVFAFLLGRELRGKSQRPVNRLSAYRTYGLRPKEVRTLEAKAAETIEDGLPVDRPGE